MLGRFTPKVQKKSKYWATPRNGQGGQGRYIYGSTPRDHGPHKAGFRQPVGQSPGQ
jgi:hypothetical protein